MPVTELFKTLATLLENSWKVTFALAVGTGILLYAPEHPLVPFVKDARAGHGALLAIAFWICASHFIVFALVTAGGAAMKVAHPRFTDWQERRRLSGLSQDEKAELSVVLRISQPELAVPIARAPLMRRLLRQGIVRQKGGVAESSSSGVVVIYQIPWWAWERLRKNPELLDPAPP
jgi:hypothetical protein